MGILSRNDIIVGIHQKGVDVIISDLMDHDFISVNNRSTLDEVYRLLHKHAKTVTAVFDNNTFKGLLSLDSISKYFMIQAMIKKINE